VAWINDIHAATRTQSKALLVGNKLPTLCLVTTLDISRDQANTAIREAGLSGLHNIRRIERIDELPLLGNGKIDFRSLEDRIARREAELPAIGFAMVCGFHCGPSRISP
jgi:non-ribosomal peptide synthetase component E (peptide arylation enzyme)